MISDIRANNNDQQSERRSFRISTSSDESIDRHMSGYENRGMNISDETDGLVNNYGTINGSNATIGSSGGGSAATLGADTGGNGPSGRHHIDISRDVIDFDDLNRKYGKQIHPKESFGRQLCRSAKNYGKTCSPFSVLLSLFPIVNWIKSYSIKEYLISDVIAGFTILILHIPQGMAYGMLAGLSAINGLYVSFFPVLIYSLMGTSRHLSIDEDREEGYIQAVDGRQAGEHWRAYHKPCPACSLRAHPTRTFAIISIMSSNAAHKLNAIPTDPTLHHSNSTSGAEDYTTLEVLTSLCMLTGIFQFYCPKEFAFRAII
ncbi:unnamed protein product [Medioppia subpectinata]|uniref:SLC26A/SulP transporter domain-containing protein n=1 Tax=Medioppia subpectinata TaxID=1979941 RepID=A0A7R9Q1V5_9ACAR|nr:unnamed protein product [Medioppia subpectinata]CAG2109642.1 unnamed protein product [Medioppia subpectinata]